MRKYMPSALHFIIHKPHTWSNSPNQRAICISLGRLPTTGNTMVTTTILKKILLVLYLNLAHAYAAIQGINAAHTADPTEYSRELSSICHTPTFNIVLPVQTRTVNFSNTNE